MAVVLEYSTDRGANWASLGEYTHPTSAGVHVKKVAISPKIVRSRHFRIRLTGTDAAAWGCRQWIVKAGDVIEQEHDLV